MKIKPLTLVKWDYDSLPDEWKRKHVNCLAGIALVYFGEIPNMKGHAFTAEAMTGNGHILHIDEIIPLTDEEI